jgi:hypothetical protein
LWSYQFKPLVQSDLPDYPVRYCVPVLYNTANIASSTNINKQ